MVKTLLNEVKEYKKDTLLSPVYVSIEAILEVFIPFLMALLVDNGIEKGNMGSIWFYGILMLVAAFVSLWAGAKCGLLFIFFWRLFECLFRKSVS